MGASPLMALQHRVVEVLDGLIRIVEFPSLCHRPAYEFSALYLRLPSVESPCLSLPHPPSTPGTVHATLACSQQLPFSQRPLPFSFRCSGGWGGCRACNKHRTTTCRQGKLVWTQAATSLQHQTDQTVPTYSLQRLR